MKVDAAANAQFNPSGHCAKGAARFTTDLWTTTVQAFGYDLPAFGDGNG